MNTLKHLTNFISQILYLLEDLERTLDYIDNDDLYSEIDNNVKIHLDNALTHLDIACDDISEGMYENDPEAEEFEEWD